MARPIIYNNDEWEIISTPQQNNDEWETVSQPEQSRANTSTERFRMLGQGATLGFGDEITAAGKVLGAKA